jgi:hypothetical protein
MLCSLRKIPASLPVRHVARSTHRSAGYELRYIAINYASAIASWMIEGNTLYVWYSLVGSMAHWYLFTFISVIKPACMHTCMDDDYTLLTTITHIGTCSLLFKIYHLFMIRVLVFSSILQL